MRRWLVAFVSCAASVTIASAQPAPASPVPAPASVMARRWSVALGFGPEILRSKLDDAPRVTFGTLALSGRFRIRPAIEVALGLRGGGAARGDSSTGGLYADVRYRFRPHEPLDLYAQVGLGVASVAPKDGTDVEKKGRGALRFGGGVEWRFTPLLGVAFELRFVGIGENAEVPTPIAPSLDYEMSRHSVSGMQLALDTSFYF